MELPGKIFGPESSGDQNGRKPLSASDANEHQNPLKVQLCKIIYQDFEESPDIFDNLSQLALEESHVESSRVETAMIMLAPSKPDDALPGGSLMESKQSQEPLALEYVGVDNADLLVIPQEEYPPSTLVSLSCSISDSITMAAATLKTPTISPDFSTIVSGRLSQINASDSYQSALQTLEWVSSQAKLMLIQFKSKISQLGASDSNASDVDAENIVSPPEVLDLSISRLDDLP